MKLKLTEEQLFDLASKIFDTVHADENFGKLENQNTFVRNDWIKAAWDAVEGYNTVAENIDFPGISIVRDSCRTCKYVNLYRPACNWRGDDINLECVCSHFELFEFEDDDEDDDDKKAKEDDEEKFWERIRNNEALNDYDPFHY